MSEVARVELDADVPLEFRPGLEEVIRGFSACDLILKVGRRIESVLGAWKPPPKEASPLLFIPVVLGPRVLVGPTYLGPGTACPRCAAHRLNATSYGDGASAATASTESVASAQVQSTPGCDDLFWKDLIIRELRAHTQEKLPLMLTNHLIEVDPMLATLQRHRVLRVPGCLCMEGATRPQFSSWQIPRV